jgi:hypothetical protein
MECDWSVSESDSIFVFGKEAAHKLEVAYGLLSWGGGGSARGLAADSGCLGRAEVTPAPSLGKGRI